MLTVGEDESLRAQNGGIINFVLKNGKVRLEIDLSGGQEGRADQISSRLLAVADVVKGKSEFETIMLLFKDMSIRRKQTLIIMLTSSVALLLACATFIAYGNGHLP